MYQSYFGLTEAPFSIAPDPRYLYMSQRHQEALAHLLYGVNGGGGFVLLTGEVGAGKTTVCRCLLEQIPESCDVAYIFNPKLTVAELLSTICSEFGTACPADNTSIKVFIDCINAYLLDAHARGRHSVLIIDEAQNLSADVLEQMRLLTNLETSQRKLLQIILLGQPELATMLSKAELSQLAQRIIARYHLGPLSRQEVASYVKHRLAIAGTQRPLFPPALIGRIYRLSGGIPRIINVLCDRALLGAYVEGKERVDRATLNRAAREVFHRPATLLRPLLAGLLASSTLAAAFYLPAASQPANTESKAGKPVATLPKLSSSLDRPASEPIGISQASAYTALFKSWGADYRSGDECVQAETIGLRCHATRGSLNELRQLNLPAVLKMQNRQGDAFYAALVRLDGNSAEFAIGNQTRSLPVSSLAEQWSGDYTLLWRAPTVTRRKIQPGDHGPDVAWLSRQLAQIRGKTATSDQDPAYDEAMVRQVKQFQLESGLTPDGTVGAQTMMQLSVAADSKAPKLHEAPEGK